MTTQQVTVPDIGDFESVEIIEVLINVGDEVAIEQPLITLESDKATMEIPSPTAGKIVEIKVAVGGKVSQGDLVALIEAAEDAVDQSPSAANDGETKTSSAKPEPAAEQQQAEEPAAEAKPAHTVPPTLPPPVERSGTVLPHASPSIRRLARELGADLSQIHGSGAKSRILEQDVKNWVKGQLQKKTGDSAGIPEIPAVDFSKFGEIEVEQLSRIKAISGPHLHRAWLNVPLVTHHDEADITDLEDFRKSLKSEAEAKGIRVTLLAFAMKALVNALKRFPQVNASLSPDKQSLILKKYYNIGIAVDTPQGLMVPVFKTVDKKSVFDLATEMGEVSERARNGKLKPDDLQGGCISISSLGGIGGTAFTPLVNAPEVAILGLTRAKMQPVWNGKDFDPRLMLPIDFSYDHRVIDGAQAARFVTYLCQLFSDVRRLTL